MTILFSIAFSVFSLVVAAFYFYSVFLPDKEKQEFVEFEIVSWCYSSKFYHPDTCQPYLKWVLSNISYRILHRCYTKYEARVQKYHPSILVCLSYYRVTYQHWALTQRDNCYRSPIC